VYTRYGIDPAQISYIEAHGTGTRLGDPIEANALVRAFRCFTDAQHYCAVGSAKAHIGHAAASAGVIGLMKILLSMKHHRLPGLLHFTELNPAIEFEGSAFYINREPMDWRSNNGMPLLAALNSFGHSGTNVHLVVREYIVPHRPFPRTGHHGSVCIPLSARTDEALKTYAQQLGLFLQPSGATRLAPLNLVDLAYTLQLGREPMKERVMFVVADLPALVAALHAFSEGRDDIASCWQGRVDLGRETLSPLAADEDAGHMLAGWITKGKLDKIAQLWTRGFAVDWAMFYGADRPRRLHLPTYPFARERYWAPRQRIAGHEPATAMHPLLQHNTSDLAEQRFSSTFTGGEFFLADHLVHGAKILPGVAYLEMARAAVQQAAGLPRAGQFLRLKNVVWTQPVTVDRHPVAVHIRLFAEEPSAETGVAPISYEIYTRPSDGAPEAAELHGQGVAIAVASTERPCLELDALRVDMEQGQLSGDQCYQAFRAMGLDLGPAYQGIEAIHLGNDQVLAKLRLPASIVGTNEQYVLHPSLMDAALQASIGLILRPDSDIAGNPGLPFALEELDIFGPCAATMWVLIRYAGGKPGADQSRKLDFDLCDERGTVQVRMRGFSTRVLSGDTSPISAAATGTLLLRPRWREQVANGPALDALRQLVVFCDLEQCFSRVIDPYLEGTSCFYWHVEDKAIDLRFQDYAAKLLEEVRCVLLETPEQKVLIRIVTSSPAFSGLAGLLKTVALEHPKIVGQLILVEPDESVPAIVARLQENERASGDMLVRYERGARLVAEWQEMPPATEPAPLPWKNGGVYLITGGAGGLGLIVAGEIAARARDVTLILVGRSPVHEDARWAALRDSRAQVVYRQVDVSQQQAVEELVQHIRDEHGQLHGIIHSAGLIRDNYIINKTSEELRAVLAPKVSGLVHLDLATRDVDLDFLITFSSATGALSNPGQADYATANAFMDAYAEMRNGLVAAGERRGQTLSVLWPLWRQGGMRVGEASKRLMEQTTGALAMETAAGIQALYRALASGESRVLVLAGRLSTLRRTVLGGRGPATMRTAARTATPFGPRGLLENIEAALRHAVAELLRLRLEDVELETDLSEYGLDSISLTELANMLNRRYGLELVPTLFFEHGNLVSLARYLHDEHHAVLAAHVQPRTEAVTAGGMASISLPPSRGGGEGERPRSRRRFPPVRSRIAATSATREGVPVGPEPVAVIGMSGRFPMAADLQQFWRNLQEGKDCISEIPPDRWDWRAFYGDPHKERDKTNIKWGGFIDGVGDFDPLFFGISPLEAEFMDPQQRLLMLFLWAAMEDAGYAPRDLSGTNTGIFVGTASGGYGSLIAKAQLPMESYIATGMTPSVGPNRMSFFLNLHGPSEPIETSCSSSLVAIHRAVLAIQDGSCEMAFAGGVNTIVSPEGTISLNKAGMLCEDGRCKTFSAAANGYVRAEGVGMLLLKKLTAAEAAGDHIYGIIRASAENHGGRANSLTAPNPKAQAELLKTAWRKAGIDPASVSYMELHGTGTTLGDPIEINGLKMAFKDCYAANGTALVPDSCGLGSVKSNIGHAELASGVAGVIKVLLQLRHKILVQSLHCQSRNPYVQLEDSPFYIVESTHEWLARRDASGRVLPRRAGVSSFGFGGVNVHVVIEEYVPEMRPMPYRAPGGQPAVILLSARNEERLREYAANLLDFVRRHRQHDVAGVRERSVPPLVSEKNVRAMLARILRGGEIMGWRRCTSTRWRICCAWSSASTSMLRSFWSWIPSSPSWPACKHTTACRWKLGASATWSWTCSIWPTRSRSGVWPWKSG
jgi:polyketide synthase PksN